MPRAFLDQPANLERLLAVALKSKHEILRRRAQGTYAPPADLEAARTSFRSFLSRWEFINRERGGKWNLGRELWPSQDEIVRLVDDYGVRRMCVLKAGKLGVTEVLVAFAAWRGIFAEEGARVHMFSQTGDDALALLDLVRRGIWGLPREWGIRVAGQERFGDTSRSLAVRGPDGYVRWFWSYASRKTASIAESCVHAHVDELAHMQWGRQLYESVLTTVPADGSLVVLSRGHGVENHMAALWSQLTGEEASLAEYRDAHSRALARLAEGDTATMVPLFQPYDRRPDRDTGWRAAQSETMTTAALRWFAPETPEDALAGDAESEFVDLAQWDALDVSPPLDAGDRTPAVLALDAGVRSDHFAAVLGTRHPDRHGEVAVRLVREWDPASSATGRVDFAEVKAFVRQVRADYNLVCVAYDPYQLEDMAQELGREMYWEAFDQGRRRLLADKGLRDAIVQRRVTRPPDDRGGDVLRRAVRAAGIKTVREDDALRIVKRTAGKVDAAVAASMMRYACLELNL